MASRTFPGFCPSSGFIWCLVIGILLEKVSSACIEKYVDGKTAKDPRVFVVGEKAKLQCDVSAKGSKDMVYWKNDNNVMSQDNLVVPKFEDKFNVTLKDSIYTLEWIAEADDVGVYNCTCATGGIQFPVWIKRPCNKRHHVITTEGTSDEVVEYLNTNKSYELQPGKTLNVSIAFDCDCTWPEVKREMNGGWHATSTPARCEGGETRQITGNSVLNATANQNGTTPIGCYTGHGLVTYRYKDVYLMNTMSFTCAEDMLDIEYELYYDEGETPRAPALMKIFCQKPVCPTPVPSTPPACQNNESCVETARPACEYICIIIGPIVLLCCLIPLIVTKFLTRGVVPDPVVSGEVTKAETGKPAETKANDQAKNDNVKNVKTMKKKLLAANIVYAGIITVGVVCLIALIVQSVEDANCRIPWSRRCACIRCEFKLPAICLGCVSFVGICTAAIVATAIAFLVLLHYRPKPKKKKEGPRSQTPIISQSQVHPQEKRPLPPRPVTNLSNENEVDSPRKKKHNPLRERLVNNRVGDETDGKIDLGPQNEEKDNKKIRGFSVPVSGATVGQLSNMTPEKHPLPSLDPIVTIPEGGDAVLDENAESPRKHRKKKRKKKHRHHKHGDDNEPGADDNGALTSPENQIDGYQNPGFEPDEVKVIQNERLNRHSPSDEGFSERSHGLPQSEGPTPPEDWDSDYRNHNRPSDA